MPPIRWLTQTPGRLAIGITGSAALLFLCAFAVSRYIHDTSTSVSIDLFLITAMMALLLATSALEALLVADVVMGRTWRVSEPPSTQFRTRQWIETDDIEAAARHSRSNPVRTYALFVMTFVFINGYLVERVTSGFVGYYRDFGYFQTLLRSNDPAKIHDAVTAMSNAQSERLADYALDFIAPLLASDNPTIQATALDACTLIGRRMSLSVDLLNLENAKTDRWEYELNQNLREHIGPVVQMLASTSETPTKIRAILALGAFRNPDSIPFLADRLSDSRDNPDVMMAIVTALAEMRDLSAIAPLLTVLRDSEAESHRVMMAAFGIGEIIGHWRPGLADKEPPAIVTEAVETLSALLPDMQGATQCVVVDAFRKMRDYRAGDILFRLFESPTNDFICPDVEIPRESFPPFVLSQRERFRIRILRAISLIAVGNAEVVEWLTEQSGRKNYYNEDLLRELNNVLQMAKTAAH